MTLKELNRQIKTYAKEKNVQCRFFQSNHEGHILDVIHNHRTRVDGILINPGALTHYSYSLRDAITGISLPTVEVHLSDIQRREAFRRNSVIKPVCIKQISGFGINSYFKGIDVLIKYFMKNNQR
jgi:3-dehydroquinate dehydratase-2